MIDYKDINFQELRQLEEDYRVKHNGYGNKINDEKTIREYNDGFVKVLKDYFQDENFSICDTELSQEEIVMNVNRYYLYNMYVKTFKYPLPEIYNYEMLNLLEYKGLRLFRKSKKCITVALPNIEGTNEIIFGRGINRYILHFKPDHKFDYIAIQNGTRYDNIKMLPDDIEIVNELTNYFTELDW